MSRPYSKKQLETTASALGIATRGKTITQLEQDLLSVARQRAQAGARPPLEEKRAQYPLSQEEQKQAYFLGNAPLLDQQKKYCRCVAHVSAKNPEWCNRERAWFSVRNGKQCANPFSICTKSTKRRGQIECSINFDFRNFPEEELRAYADLFYNQILEVNGWRELPTSRKALEEGLAKWQSVKRIVSE